MKLQTDNSTQGVRTPCSTFTFTFNSINYVYRSQLDLNNDNEDIFAIKFWKFIVFSYTILYKTYNSIFETF